MLSTIVELKGHLIDSLTLAKVIDTIQKHQASYKVDFIDVGYQKADFSTAHLTVGAETSQQLQALLTELKTYGATPLQGTSSELTACPADATPPEHAILLENCVKHVLIAGEWVDIEGKGSGKTAVVYDPAKQVAQLVPQAQLKKGQLTVVRTQNQAPDHIFVK